MKKAKDLKIGDFIYGVYVNTTTGKIAKTVQTYMVEKLEMRSEDILEVTFFSSNVKYSLNCETSKSTVTDGNMIFFLEPADTAIIWKAICFQYNREIQEDIDYYLDEIKSFEKKKLSDKEIPNFKFLKFKK